MGSIIKASIWLTVSELAFNLAGYLIHSLLGRFLGPADYGRFSLIITFSTMVVVLIARGVPVAMSKYLSEVYRTAPEKIRPIKKTGILVQTALIGIVTVIYFLLAPFFAYLLNDPSLTGLFRLSAPIIPAFALASFYMYYFTGIHLFEKQALIKFYRSAMKIILIVGLGYFFLVPGAIVGQALAPFSVFLCAYFLDPYRGFRFNKKESVAQVVSWKKMLTFAWPITLFMIFYEVMITIDLYLVKILLKDDALTGIYNSAITVGRIPFYAFYFLTIILLPKISETTSRGLEEETKRILRSAMRFMLILLIPSVALLSLFSESAIRFFYGARYSAAAEALAVLAFGSGFLVVFYVLAFVLNGAGRNKIPMWTAMAGCFLNFFLGFILIPKFGIAGAAVGTTIASFVTMFIVTAYARMKITKFIFLSSFLKYVAAAAAAYLLGSLFFWQGRFIFILWSAILMVIYFMVLYALGELKKEDWQIFVKAFRRKKNLQA